MLARGARRLDPERPIFCSEENSGFAFARARRPFEPHRRGMLVTSAAALEVSALACLHFGFQQAAYTSQEATNGSTTTFDGSVKRSWSCPPRRGFYVVMFIKGRLLRRASRRRVGVSVVQGARIVQGQGDGRWKGEWISRGSSIRFFILRRLFNLLVGLTGILRRLGHGVAVTMGSDLAGIVGDDGRVCLVAAKPSRWCRVHRAE